jgi:hypothetical protein
VRAVDPSNAEAAAREALDKAAAIAGDTANKAAAAASEAASKAALTAKETASKVKSAINQATLDVDIKAIREHCFFGDRGGGICL